MRAFLTGPLIRLFPVGLVLLAIQRVVFSQVHLAGTVIEIMLALAACTGAGAGAERGAVAGFTLGLMYDLGSGTPLGLTALVYAVAGFTAGYGLSWTPTPPWWLSSLFASLGAAVGELCQPLARVMIGEDGWFDARLYRLVPVAALSTLFVSPLFIPLGRWCMRVKRQQWKVMAP